MAYQNTITVVGNLTADPELVFMRTGESVANFTVASTPRFFNSDKKEWENGETAFVRCSVWRQEAENLAHSLAKGDRVVVTGSLRQNNWEDKDTGDKRSSLDMVVDEVGASMKFTQVSVVKRKR